MRPFPSLSLYQRTVTSSFIPSISWRDGKLYHVALSDIALGRLAVVMIALSLLGSHHYKGQLNTTVPSSPRASMLPRKNVLVANVAAHPCLPPDVAHRKTHTRPSPHATSARGGGATLWVLSPTLSLSLRVSIYSKVWLELWRVCLDNPSKHLHVGK